MTREIKDDLDLLKKFVAEYSTRDLSNNSEFVRLLTVLHKKYLSLLIFLSEFEFQNKRKGKDPFLKTDSLDYLRESISDIGNTFFCWMQGAYKPAKLTLRSSIETFIKGIGSQENQEILEEKNLFKLFDIVKKNPHFTVPTNKAFFSSLHSAYRVLCLDVHTATRKNMAQINALKFFPHFQSKNSEKTARIISKVITDLLSLLCLIFDNVFHKMHHRNKESIMESLPVKIRRILAGLEPNT